MPENVPIRRTLYLMERITRRTWYTVATGRREIKIGISVNPKTRLKTVNRGIKGKIILIAEYKVNKASTIESKLHKKYAAKNMKIKGAKGGSGSTEFFRLTDKEVREIERYLSKVSNKDKIAFLLIALFSTSIVIIAHFFLS